MKQLNKMRERWTGFIDTVTRFPLTIILLVAAFISNVVAINTQEDDIFIRLLITFILGASIYAVLQLIYERFYNKPAMRIVFMGISVVAAVLYYSFIRDTEWDVEVVTRTTVILFVLLIAFIWVPIIQSRNNFNDSFMAVFKGFFVAGFFSGVLYLGVSLILVATDMLITNVDGEAYMHSANIIFILFAPIYFLSLIPFYPRKEDLEEDTSEKAEVDSATVTKIQSNPDLEIDTQSEKVRREEALIKFTTPAKFLETLISYVIIPITAVFTIILLLYIIMNVSGDFWTDNLMEPLLVAYSITVIIVYVLASTINNAFSKLFRKVFPKVLVPIVLFQTLSSVLKIGELGVTYGRYYVIMFGIFATTVGILLCIIPVRKNGILAPILITLSIISIVPPIDSFTVSFANQRSRLENVLEKNNMFDGETVKPNANIPKEDKEIIVTSIHYINRIDNTKDIEWLSKYNKSLDFERTFGFAEYGRELDDYQNYYISRDINTPISITGYDFMLRMNVYSQRAVTDTIRFELNNQAYSLRLESKSEDNQELILAEEGGQELSRYAMKDIFAKFSSTNAEKSFVSNEKVTFTQDNAAATLTIIADSISVNEWSEGKDQSADLNILVKIK